jgi:ribonuclease HI
VTITAVLACARAAAAAAHAIVQWRRRRPLHPDPHAPTPTPAPPAPAQLEPAPEPEPARQDEPAPEVTAVSDDMLAALAARFAGPPPDDGFARVNVHTGTARVTTQLADYRLRHQHEHGDGGLIVATDGSVDPDHKGFGACAAVCSDGRARIGQYDTDPPVTSSHHAELQAIRLALRLLPAGADARLILDNEAVAKFVSQLITAGPSDRHPVRVANLVDAAAVNEIRNLLRSRRVAVHVVNNGAAHTLTHTNHLLAAAHCLSYAMLQLQIAGRPYDPAAKAFLEQLAAPGTSRSRRALRARCERWLAAGQAAPQQAPEG